MMQAVSYGNASVISRLIHIIRDCAVIQVYNALMLPGGARGRKEAGGARLVVFCSQRFRVAGLFPFFVGAASGLRACAGLRP